jgi:hypothetical protein
MNATDKNRQSSIPTLENEDPKMSKFRLFLMIALACGAMTPGSAFPQGGLPEQAERALEITPQAAVVTSACPAGRMTIASSNDINVTTTSPNFVDVPGMVATVNIPVTTSCVDVQYTATVFTTGNELIYVQATIDDVPCFPPDVQFEGDSDEDGDGQWARAHAFDFVCQNVTRGAHTFKIQWRSFFGGLVFTHWRTMKVIHR